MASTIRTFVSDGSTTVYDAAFDLGYISKDYVYVYLVDDEYDDQLAYTWINSTQIELDTVLGIGVEFHVRRVVPRNSPVNDYADGAVFKEKNLDDSFLQSLMILEEVADGYDSSYTLWRENVDANGFQLNNLPVATLDGQPVVKETFDVLDVKVAVIEGSLASLDSALVEFDEETTEALAAFGSESDNELAEFHESVRLLGYVPKGNFSVDGTVTSSSDAVYHTATDYFYMWTGTLPHDFTAGTDPSVIGSGWKIILTGYIQQSSAILKFGRLIDIDITISSQQDALSIRPEVEEGSTVEVLDGALWVIL